MNYKNVMNWKSTLFRKLAVPLLLLALVATSVTLPPGLFAADDSVALAAAPSDAEEISAPDVDLHMYLWLEGGRPYYSIVYKGEELVKASRMGIETNLGSLSSDFTELNLVSTDSGDSTWSPLVGEKSVIEDKYNAKTFQLKKSGNLSLSIEMRAYNTGVAFRYLLPDASVHGNYNITDEQTRFNLAPDGIALSHVKGQQQVATKTSITSLPDGIIYPPLTAVFDSGPALTITESRVDNYAFHLLRTDTEGRLKPRSFTSAAAATVSVTPEGPAASPYWTFVVGDTLADLPVNKDIIFNLNDEPDEDTYHYSEWVKPGKAWMMGLFDETTESLRDWIDTVSKCGLEYLLLDFGWYGPEFDQRSDPRLDPSKLIEAPGDSAELKASKDFMRPYVTDDGVFNAVAGGRFDVYANGPSWAPKGRILMQPNLNIPEIVEYAESKGVGIFLYVNDKQLYDPLNRYTLDELFARLKSWGIAGLKPGFVGETLGMKKQVTENFSREIVETAARHELMLAVHDEWLQTGIEREFPHLLTVEGVFGDEGLETQSIEGDLNALFARGIQGAADHTICYPGKASRGFQLASSVLWPTGLNCVYWPWKNTDTNNREAVEALPPQEREFWKYMPATWDDLVILEAKVSESAVTARRTGDIWYMGGISVISQYMKMPLDFLTPGKKYVAEIYHDRKGNNGNNSNRNNKTESAHLLFSRYKVDSDTVLGQQMEFGTGIAVRIRPIEAGDENLPDYTAYFRFGDLVSLCEDLDPDMYSPATWSELESALIQARPYVGLEELPPPSILDPIYTALKNAYEGLEIIAEPMALGVEGDATIQSWINASSNEQGKNYGGANVLRLLSITSGYGRFGEAESTVGTSGLDAKISLLKINIAGLKADRTLKGGKLQLTYNGLTAANGKTQTSLAAARVINPNWTEGTGNDAGNSTDGVKWSQLGTGESYQLQFDMETLCQSDPFDLSSPAGTRISIDVSEILKKVPQGEDYISFAIFETAGAEIKLYSREGAASQASYRPALTLYLEPADKMELEGISVVDGSNVPLTGLTSNTMKTELTVRNGHPRKVTAIMSVAVYTPDGKLAHFGSEVKTLPAFTRATYPVTVTMPENIQGQYAKNGYYAKAFLWESTTGEPLMESIAYFKQ